MILPVLQRLRQETLLQLFTIYLRYLIGGAFVLAAIGMRKIFPSELPPDNDVHPLDSMWRMFQTLQHAGFYYQFIGWAQIVAGALLMTQSFSRLGAILYFPIILNIFILTVCYHFGLTIVITFLLLVANAYLLLWDYPTLRYILLEPKTVANPQPDLRDDRYQLYWVITGIVMCSSLMILCTAGILFQVIAPPVLLLIWVGEFIVSIAIYGASQMHRKKKTMQSLTA